MPPALASAALDPLGQVEHLGLFLDPMPYVVGWMAVLLRALGVLAALPIWREGTVPPRIRAAVAAYVALVMGWGLGLPRVEAAGPGSAMLVLLGELLLGVGLGLFVRMVLALAEGLGRLVSYSVGLGFATFVDPSTGGSADAATRIASVVFALLFLSVDAHLEVLRALFATFRVVAIGEAGSVVLSDASMGITELGAGFFELSVVFAAPVIAVTLVVNVVLAVIAKVAPQMNVFAFGFLLTIPAGLFLWLATTPEISARFLDSVGRLPEEMLRWTAGGGSR